jgi:hypothetical protein
MEWLKNALSTVEHANFRKVRARMMQEAYLKGESTRRNVRVAYADMTFKFYYRGSLIMEWDMVTDETRNVSVGAYETAASTIYQRTQARNAIHEFREVLHGFREALNL